MLRLLVAALLVANLLFWAWHHTALVQALGLPAGEPGREPERLQRQYHPEAIQLLKPDARPVAPSNEAAVAASAAADATTVCLEAGPLNDAAASAAGRELGQAGVPAGGWVDMRRELPGRWIVYMGRYPERDTLVKKTEELQRLGMSATEVRSPAELAPGLALGDFASQAEAQGRLERLQARGVRTARVLQLPSPGTEHRLRVDRVAPAVAERLAALSGQEGAIRWQPCPASP
jgi:hypothetical protein